MQKENTHLKASEIFTLQIEAEFKAKEEKAIEIAKKLIIRGLDSETISEITDLMIEQIEELRQELEK